MKKVIAAGVFMLALLTGIPAASAAYDPGGGGSRHCVSSKWHSGQRAYLVIWSDGRYSFSKYDLC